MIGYIYGIKNKLNGRWYVGQTTRPYQIRWLEHRTDLQNKEHHSYKLQDAFNEFGIEVFEWTVLEEVEADTVIDISVLLTRREQSWCAKNKGVKEGYNVLTPGKKYVSPEDRKKIRDQRIEKIKANQLNKIKNAAKKKNNKKPAQKNKKVSGKEAASKAKSISNKWKKMDGCF